MSENDCQKFFLKCLVKCVFSIASKSAANHFWDSLYTFIYFSAINGFIKDEFTPVGKGSITDGKSFIKVHVLCSKDSGLLDITEGTNVTVVGELVFTGEEYSIFIWTL